MILISIFWMILLADIVGTVSYAFWKKIIVRFLVPHGEVVMIRISLTIVLLLHLLPVSFLYQAGTAGIFGARKTGTMFSLTPWFSIGLLWIAYIWLVGFLKRAYHYLKTSFLSQRFLQLNHPARPEIQELCERLKAEMGIRRRIVLCETDEVCSPMLVSFRSNMILVPAKPVDWKMEVIMEHELRHYKQRDPILQKLCAWIVRIHWFNPMTPKLIGDVVEWGEACCDYYICQKSIHHWDVSRYGNLILDYASADDEDWNYTAMRLAKDPDAVRRRIMRMRELKTRKRMKPAVLIALLLCFLMTSGLTSIAAGEAAAGIYGKIYEATRVMKTDGEIPVQDLEEYTWTADPADVVITDTEIDLDERSLKSYTWDIPAGKTYETQIFHATKGEGISIAINPSPRNAKIGTGLSQPDGIMRGVTGTGVYGYPITVNQNGFHRVYVYNPNSYDVTVAFSVARD